MQFLTKILTFTFGFLLILEVSVCEKNIDRLNALNEKTKEDTKNVLQVANEIIDNIPTLTFPKKYASTVQDIKESCLSTPVKNDLKPVLEHNELNIEFVLTDRQEVLQKLINETDLFKQAASKAAEKAHVETVSEEHYNEITKCYERAADEAEIQINKYLVALKNVTESFRKIPAEIVICGNSKDDSVAVKCYDQLKEKIVNCWKAKIPELLAVAEEAVYPLYSASSIFKCYYTKLRLVRKDYEEKGVHINYYIKF